MSRTIALLCGAFAIVASGRATLYTSKAGGTTYSVASSWASGSTGGSIPGIGDQISCAGPLAFDVTATFGTSGASGTFDFTSTSACVPSINPGVALTVNGGLMVHAMGLSSLTASFVIDNGASLTCAGANVYTISPDGAGALVMVQALGTLGAGTAITGCNGDADAYGTVGGGLVATYLTLSADHWYAAMNPNYAVTWNVQHSKMNVNAGWRYPSGGINVVIDEYNTYPATGSLMVTSESAYSTGPCLIKGDSFDSFFGPSLLASGPLSSLAGGMVGCTITGSALLGGVSVDGDGTGLMSGNVIIQSAASSSSTTGQLVMCSSFARNLIVNGLSYQVHKHTPDFCGAAVTATGNQTWSINGNVLDGISVNPTNLPDDGFVAPNSTKTSGTATFLFSLNIVLRRPDGAASMALADIRQWEGGYAHVFDHNTINCGFQGEGCITAELEGSTTMWYPDGGSITNNIFWTSSSVTGEYPFDTALLGYVSLVNPMAPAGLHHNATWNLGGVDSSCTGSGPSYALPCTNQGGGYIGNFPAASLGTNTSSSQAGDVWNTNPTFANVGSNYAQFAAYAGVVASSTWTAESSGHTFAIGDLISDNNASNLDGTAIIFRCIQSHVKSTAGSEPGNTWEGSATVWPVWANYWELASNQVMRTNVPAGNTITDASIGCSSPCSYPDAAVGFIRKGNTPRNAAMHADSGGGWIGAVNATPPAPATGGGALSISGNASAQ